MLDYFIFASGHEDWAIYCPETRSIIYAEYVAVLGDSKLLSNSKEYIGDKYNDNMSSICKKCPEFTVHAKGLLHKTEKKVFVKNKNYNLYSSKNKYLIKVEGKINKSWSIANKNKKIFTANNIIMKNSCETEGKFIKTHGFFYKKSNIISHAKIFT